MEIPHVTCVQIGDETYEAFPGLTAKKIKSLAAEAGVALDTGSGSQLPLLVIMPMKSGLVSVIFGATMGLLKRLLAKGADGIGTVHFAHIVQLPNNKVGFFTLYDGPFEKYVLDFATHMGPAFDLMFKFVSDPADTPVSKNVASFTKWSRENDLPPLGFFNAYPGLVVQDIRALAPAS